MKYKRTLVVIASIVVSLLCSRPLLADGCFLPSLVQKLPDIPVQRTIIRYKDGVETLMIESTFAGEGMDFAWVIPVPNVPRRIEKASPGLLKTLSVQLAPQIIHTEYSYLAPYIMALVGLFLLCLTIIFRRWRSLVAVVLLIVTFLIIIPQFASYRAGPGNSLGIKLISRKAIGSYEVFVVKANDHGDLNSWLTNNGFITMPDRALPIIDDYIEKKWCFVAAKLIRKHEGTSAPHPILLEFSTEKPVYPMRLTALPGSHLHLELFVIAEEEAAPVNSSLRKEYCNYFDYKDSPYGPENYWGLSTPEKKFVGRSSLGGWSFWWRRKPLRDHDQINHPDAKDLMWNGCVVTKLAGEIPSSEMEEDIFLRFTNTAPYRAFYHSYQAAHVHALSSVAVVLMFGLPIFTVIYCWGSRWRLEGASGTLVLALPIGILLALCGAEYVDSYHECGNKTEVEVLSGSFQSEWNCLITIVEAYIADLNAQVNLEFSDAEWRNITQNEDWVNYPNPFTREPVIFEDSPGNVTAVWKYGLLKGFNIYWMDGTPEFTWTDSFLKRLEIEQLIQELRDENPAYRLSVVGELGEREDARALEPLVATMLEGNRLADTRTCEKGIEAIAKIDDPAAVEILIELLESARLNERSDVQEEVARALKEITYENLGSDPAIWKNWWEINKGAIFYDR